MGQEDSKRGGFLIRQFTPEDWQIFRDMRLHALKTEPHVFSRKWEEEAPLPEARWREDLQATDKSFFGVFDGDNLVGITGVFADRGDSSGKTAMLGASYVLPEYRGQKLSRLFYQSRIAWVVAHPQYDRIFVSHRLTNNISKSANQRFGFVYTHTVPDVKWPDGAVEDEICYQMDVAALKP